VSDYVNDQSARREAESFELEKIRQRNQLRAIACPKLVLTTIAPRELREYLGFPVVPTVRLGVGGSVEIWLVIAEGFSFRWEHAASSLPGARRELLQLMIARAFRVCALEVCAELGIPPAR